MSTYTSQINSGITGSLADRKRLIAIIAPPILIISMYPVFQLLAGIFENERVAWYLGLAIYWLSWGVIFPLILIGPKNIGELIKPRKINRKILLLLAIPLIGSIAAKLVPGMGEYEKESALTIFLLFSSPFCNGLFEEVLWRGVYVKLFPTNIFFRMIWPSI